MDRLMKCCLIIGLALLGFSAPFAGRSNGGLPPTVSSASAVTNSDCTSSFQCAGYTSDDGNNCSFSDGRVPTCQSPVSGMNCSYTTQGYICSGTDSSGNNCNEQFYGCR